jgi:N-acetylglucosaminyldiphosphoundecaprenol N-acetyl-beta-D-mannosaminyltransferase
MEKRVDLQTDERLRILGIPVDATTFDGLLESIAAWIARRDRTYQICTVSPEFVMIAQDDPDFRRVLREADLCAADGVGILFAARYLGQPLPERVTGSDGVPLIATRAAREGWKLFLLGAGPGIAEQTAVRLFERHPGLQIVGTYAGSPAPEEEDEIITRVNDSGADILFVAYGAPRQDQWIARNRERLNVSVAMGVGGTFDFIAGVVPRAPRWMRSLALEWLFRLVRQPWRWRRMLRLPRFVWAVLWYRERGMRE